MLLVKRRLGPSAISGIGLFADEHIPEGKRIWELTPGFDLKVAREKIDALPEAAREQMMMYSYVEYDTGLHVICMDRARHFNHSYRPNTREIPSVATIAVRDIMPGEELTGDYRTFDADWKRELGLE